MSDVQLILSVQNNTGDVYTIVHNATTTPDTVDNREDAGTPGDLRKGLEIRVGKVSGQDDAVEYMCHCPSQ